MKINELKNWMVIGVLETMQRREIWTAEVDAWWCEVRG